MTKGKEQIAGYLVINCQDEVLEKTKEFINDFKDSPINPGEVVITYKGQKVEHTMRDFLDMVGFELPCEDSNLEK